MARSDIEVAIIGGGAAGIAAGRRLRDASIDCLVIEARPRLGGRAWSVVDPSGFALDLGCGWLHSADRNPWSIVAKQQGRAIDTMTPPWQRPSIPTGFPVSEQREFRAAMAAFYHRMEAIATMDHDVPTAAFLEADGRWNGLINAASSYISGAETDRVSAKDLDRYRDNGVNWRVVDGYGTVVAAHGKDLPLALDCPVRSIDHSGKRMRIETARGVITADQAIVTLPSTILAETSVAFTPALPEKTAAAAQLPLGLADKLFMSLDGADEFETDTRLFGHTDRAATATYHMRPFGRPQIEAYFGGRLAADLEAQDEGAFFDFAVSELVGQLGNDFRRRVKPLQLHRWGVDRFARGSYSFALPGGADCRAVLAAPVDDRLFFAGEACSAHDFSTAHGAWSTGIAAADAVITARRRQRS